MGGRRVGSRTSGSRVSAWAGLALVLGVLATVPSATASSARTGSSSVGLATAVFDPIEITAPNADAAFSRVKDAGASFVRVLVEWQGVAPGGATKPTGFNASNPAASGYKWSNIDTLVTRAVADGLTPILDIVGAPHWATGPSSPGVPYVRPSPTEFGRFAQAAATRYSGSYGSLPRVSYWQAWNEPNKVENLAPQQVAATAVSPVWYRQMVNAFARGVHRVHADNMVIAGSLAPYARSADSSGIPPLTFMKELLCLSGRQIRPRPSCLERAHFDIWAMQPYTWGSPVHKATVTGDVALGDLPTMKSVLDQAWSQGRIVSDAAPPFWVTEFSYDTNPPDTGAVPIDVQTRWTSESLYRMWQAGVSLVTWFAIRDQPPPSVWQSGLWKTNGGTDWSTDTKKTTFEAFRFPVVAFPEGTGTRVWARVPPGVSGNVTFQVGGGAVWVTIGTVTPSDGIATAVLAPALSTQSVRGVLSTGEKSIPFSLTNDPDCPGPSYCPVNPFGN